MVPLPEQFDGPHITSAGLQEWTMLGWVVTFLIIGLIAAILGFGGIAGASFAAAKIIFFVAILLLLLSIVFGAIGRPL
jgi:uncharacterized membrane protein YtjA (UPF0391 family)